MAQLKSAVSFFALAQELVFGPSTLLKDPRNLAQSDHLYHSFIRIFELHFSFFFFFFLHEVWFY